MRTWLTDTRKWKKGGTKMAARTEKCCNGKNSETVSIKCSLWYNKAGKNMKHNLLQWKKGGNILHHTSLIFYYYIFCVTDTLV